ncbi:MAG: histidine kinase [Oscillospiraceae bacterium]|nr:histidine kinase [Oscillospiraceae bacterium]
MPKHTRHRFSQRTRLFSVYGIFILLVLLSLFIYIYHFNRQNVLHDATIKQTNICASVRDSVTTELDNMSTISLNLVYSSAIRKNFSSFASYAAMPAPSATDTLHSRSDASAIYDVITAMIGSYQTVTQVNLYTMDGSCVGSGFQQRISTVKLNTLPWYQKVTAQKGLKYISAPETNLSLPAKNANQSSHCFMSLNRMFFNEKDKAEGIFEVVQDCGQIFALADEMQSSNNGLHLYIYNDRNELVYPYAGSEAHTDYLALTKNAHLKDGEGCMLSVSAKSSQLISCSSLSKYGWTVVAAEPQATVYASLIPFRASFLCFAAAALLATLAICFLLAKQMSLPLRKLTHTIKKLTIDRVLDSNQKAPALPDSNIAEIADLCTSYQNMYSQLCTSSHDLLLARSEEIRADLQATQSLINPHFLYNSLTSISILAEDGEDAVITHLCNALCDYFRYISDSSQSMVPLQEELDCTEKYISCMQIRFGDALSYTNDVSPEIGAVLIPKLIVQPLVENAFKYAFNGPPPWFLHVSATSDGNVWRICVEDSGGCLSDEKRSTILSELHHMHKADELQNMKIGGMGLKNVWLRLILLYGDQAFFDIDNHIPGKTTFLIGGPVNLKKESPTHAHL